MPSDVDDDAGGGTPGLLVGGAIPTSYDSGTCAAKPTLPVPHPSIRESQNIPSLTCPPTDVLLIVISSPSSLTTVDQMGATTNRDPSRTFTAFVTTVIGSPSSLPILTEHTLSGF